MTTDRIVVVVLDSYDHFDSLASMRADVATVTDAWGRAGFAVADVEPLGAGTLLEIQAWVAKWSPPPARQLIVYWTGHGKQLSEGTFVLLARDTDADRIDATNTVPIEHLGAALSRFDVDEIVVFVDACDSGGGHRELVDAFVRGSRRLVRSGGRGRPVIAAIASADYEQYAGEKVFSVALARVLQQGPPKGFWGDQQQDFTVAELVAAVRSVIAESELDQQPQFALDGVSAHHSGDLRIRNPRYRTFAPDIDGEKVGSRPPVPETDLDEHFWLKFRGIDSAEQEGCYFTGRAQILREINHWLTDSDGMLVVTGRPGVGKSALLGRTVIMATPQLRRRLPELGVDVPGLDQADLPPAHAIDVALHARNKGLVDCMADIAAALRITRPEGGWSNPAQLVDAVTQLSGPVTILVDALDEARPIDVLRIAGELLAALSKTPVVRVLVGTRADSSDPLSATPDEPTGHNTILRALGTYRLINVDDYDATGDIYAYSAERLRALPDSLYADDDPMTAGRVARLASAVTERCHGSFLHARIATRALAAHERQLDENDPAFEALVRTDIHGAIGADLARYGYEEEKVDDLLTALALAEGSGLPRRAVWLTVANAIRRRPAAYEDPDLVWVLNHAGTYITQSGERGETVYRLYHQALTEYFHGRTEPAHANRRIAEALVGLVPGPADARRWDRSNPYTREHLATHAANGGVLLDLVDDRIFPHAGAGRMAAALLLTADAAPDTDTLDRAVELLRTAVAATARSEADRDEYRYGLLLALQIREQRLQSLMDADEAIELNEDLLARTTEDSPAYPVLLANLGWALRTRYARSGDRQDLDRAIDDLIRALSLSPPGTPARHECLHQLGQALLSLAERTGDLAALDDAIAHLRQAGDGATVSQARRHDYLAVLGDALRLRLERTGTLADLDEAIAVSAQAADLAPPGDPNRPRYLSILASALLLRYSEAGSRDDLARAVTSARSAVASARPEDARLGQYHSVLSRVLQARHLDTGDPADLNSAVDSAHRAVAVSGREDPQRPRRLSVLGAVLLAAYDATRDLENLDAARSACAASLSELSLGHPDRPDALVALGTVEHKRFEAGRDREDLDLSVRLLQEADAATPTGHVGRPQRLLALARSLRARFDVGGDSADLDGSTDALRQAVAASSSDRPEHATYLLHLAGNLAVQGRRREAERHFRRALAVATAPIAVRMRAARDLGALAAANQRFAEATDAYAAAVELMPRLASSGLNRATVIAHLAEWSGLASDAAACAINAGRFELAVGLLEQGRGVLWAQALSSRTDLSLLAVYAPALAARLTDVRDRLAQENPAPSDDVDRRMRLAREWDDLVAQVRGLPGFGDFLAAPRIEDLLALATQGPIVIVNVSRYRCDALILRPSGVEVFRLPKLTADDAQQQLTAFLDTVGHSRRPSPLPGVLAWLWECAVGPILRTLDLDDPPQDGIWPRVWWCPTGPLTLMPLHAAGSALDHVLSSYLPTVAALLHTRRSPDASALDGVLAVGMPNPSVHPPLPHAAVEIEVVRRSAEPELAVVLLDEQATVPVVIEHMRRHRWVHFACHGGQDLTDPARSALVLHEGLLTVLDVAALRIEGAELMYLASCQTAMGGIRLVDESIHMAAAMQLAGYRHVVAALWPIDDRMASKLAGGVYGRLSSSDGLRGAEAAHALQMAVLEMRAVHPDRPERWAPFIHMGP